MEVSSLRLSYLNYLDTDNNPSWEIKTDGRYATAIYNYLIEDGIPDEGASKIIQNAAKVLGYCPNSKTSEPVSSTGIVIGKVQSGKTSNFIALTALAFDNGYDHIVVLGGTTNILVEQNGSRISEYFESTPEVVVWNTTQHQEYLNTATIKSQIAQGKKVIIVALKKRKRIDSLREDIFEGSLFEDQCTLIIDDEGDEASLNTLIKKGKKSATYQAIEDLKKTLKRHSFISVTATPQANLLIDSIDILSPEFGVLVDPGNGYCGLDVFHAPGSKYIIEIPEDEESLLDGIPTSFVDALAMYFVGCGIFTLRGKKPEDKFSMLVHPSALKMDHSSAKEKAESIICRWQLLAKNKNDIAYNSLKKKLKKQYDEYIRTTVPDAPDFAYVEENALKAILACHVHLVNGDSVPKDADKFFDYNIYVGGTMLGRGLTLKGLAITYIIRTPKGKANVDTTAQRARWFGYKKKYIDLCRVFAVKKIAKEFRSIREHENDLWETVKEADLQGTNFKDITRIFLLDDGMRMTRSNVAETTQFIFKPWILQKHLWMDSDYINSNYSILNSFRKKHEQSIKIHRISGGAPYAVLKDLPFENVVEELTDKFEFPRSSSLNSEIIRKLLILLKEKQIEPVVDVIWMRDGTKSVHEVCDGEVDNYMVGKRPKGEDKPIIYRGDYNEFEREGALQIQIHDIQDRSTQVSSPALALHIPKDYLEKLTNLVLRG